MVTTKGIVEKTITQLKWLKCKDYLNQLRRSIGSHNYPGPLSHKLLERVRGYLNHIALTYEIVTPFLRSFHNTIDSWRENRTVDGWKEDDYTSKWSEVLNHYLVEEKISEDLFDHAECV